MRRGTARFINCCIPNPGHGLVGFNLLTVVFPAFTEPSHCIPWAREAEVLSPRVRPKPAPWAVPSTLLDPSVTQVLTEPLCQSAFRTTLPRHFRLKSALPLFLRIRSFPSRSLSSESDITFASGESLKISVHHFLFFRREKHVKEIDRLDTTRSQSRLPIPNLSTFLALLCSKTHFSLRHAQEPVPRKESARTIRT